ncbi:MAG TPA: family 16 glycoside hydrolase, partial [Gemmataceae bacterium]|nr:family 16 glycoside hydrolase [Gemmataceae bacterium]
MPFPFTCPHCGNFTQVADHLAGSVVPCLACGASVELPPPVPEPSAETANADPAGLVFANEPGAPLSTGAQISKGAGVKKRSKGLKIKIAIAGVIAHVVVISVGVWLLVWQSSGPAETTTTKPVTQAPRTQPAPAPMPSPNPSRVKDEYATIILENLPEDADVFVDDALKLKTKGKTTEELRVTAGKQHQIRVKKEGYQDFEKSVPKIDADGRIHIAVELKPNPPPDSGFSPILNKSSHPDWRIVDGILGHFGPPATNTLLTKRDDYKDFILRLELRLRKPGGNSYVIFRHTLQNYYLVKIDDKRNGQLVWAQRDPNRANVLQEGIAEPLDQWIKLEIRAVENRLNIIVNDRSLTDYVDDKNAAGGGQIGLHVDNQNVEFRNIEVKVLASASAPKGIAIERRGWTPHLNGKFEAGFPSRAGFRRVGAGLLADGGNQASEDAVARGLKWLAKQQHKGDEKDPLRGSWATDGTTKSRVAGTGLAVLAFLAAGYTDRV